MRQAWRKERKICRWWKLDLALFSTLLKSLTEASVDPFSLKTLHSSAPTLCVQRSALPANKFSSNTFADDVSVGFFVGHTVDLL
jgi:hypothetical protein